MRIELFPIVALLAVSSGAAPTEEPTEDDFTRKMSNIPSALQGELDSALAKCPPINNEEAIRACLILNKIDIEGLQERVKQVVGITDQEIAAMQLAATTFVTTANLSDDSDTSEASNEPNNEGLNANDVYNKIPAIASGLSTRGLVQRGGPPKNADCKAKALATCVLCAFLWIACTFCSVNRDSYKHGEGC